ncbi:MAG: hypothetical protein LBE91_05385 [Tannerella sp.]|jgi:hypothetical protein|nr:hypothetical protein [Tannerella sp.]
MIKIKKIIFVLFMVCFSCQDQLEPSDSEIKECGVIEINDNEFILMKFVPDRVSSQSTNLLIIENQTSHELNWGANFSLEFYEKNTWKKIPSDELPILIGYFLTAGDIYTDDMFISSRTLYTLVKDLNKGKKGRYRIIRQYSLHNVGTYKLCAEFEVI